MDKVTVGGNLQKEYVENVSQFLPSMRKRGSMLNQSKTFLSVHVYTFLDIVLETA